VGQKVKVHMNETTNGNGNNGKSRIDWLKRKLDDDRAALALEMSKRAKRQRRENEKLQAVIGAAVLKACAQSADFQLMISQTALCNVTDDKVRRLLAERGLL
jgi:hypothetical protein